MTKHTPLTLEFSPAKANFLMPDGSEAQTGDGRVVVEPSLEVPGRIFMVVSPGNSRLGLHLLPNDARVIRDHLSKLLIDPETPVEAPVTPAEPEVKESIQSRIDRAVERLKAERKRPLIQFRLEFRLGSIEGVIGRIRGR